MSSDDVVHDPGFDLASDFGLVINTATNESAGNYSCSTIPGREFDIISVDVIGGLMSRCL